MNQMIAEADFVNATADKHAQGNPMLPLAASGLRFAINGRALVERRVLERARARRQQVLVGRQLNPGHIREVVGTAQDDKMLDRLQSLAPAGVFARSLRECLELQLRERGDADPAMSAVLASGKRSSAHHASAR